MTDEIRAFIAGREKAVEDARAALRTVYGTNAVEVAYRAVRDATEALKHAKLAAYGVECGCQAGQVMLGYEPNGQQPGEPVWNRCQVCEGTGFVLPGD